MVIRCTAVLSCPMPFALSEGKLTRTFALAGEAPLCDSANHVKHRREQHADASIIVTVKRLLQLMTMVLLLAGFVAPVLEFFDDWDPQGVSDDTEFGVFALIVLLCLSLLICRLLATGALRFFFAARCAIEDDLADDDGAESGHTLIFAIPPLCSLPLRI